MSKSVETLSSTDLSFGDGDDAFSFEMKIPQDELQEIIKITVNNAASMNIPFTKEGYESVISMAKGTYVAANFKKIIENVVRHTQSVAIEKSAKGKFEKPVNRPGNADPLAKDLVQAKRRSLDLAMGRK